jgi:hypothetical protein
MRGAEREIRQMVADAYEGRAPSQGPDPNSMKQAMLKAILALGTTRPDLSVSPEPRRPRSAAKSAPLTPATAKAPTATTPSKTGASAASAATPSAESYVQSTLLAATRSSSKVLRVRTPQVQLRKPQVRLLLHLWPATRMAQPSIQSSKSRA